MQNRNLFGEFMIRGICTYKPIQTWHLRFIFEIFCLAHAKQQCFATEAASLPPCSDAEDLKYEAQMPSLDGLVSADATDHEFAKKVPVLHSQWGTRWRFLLCIAFGRAHQSRIGDVVFRFRC
jgi:hypothetical protein